MVEMRTDPPMFDSVDVMLWVAYFSEVAPAQVKSPLLVLINRVAQDRGYPEVVTHHVHFGDLDDLERRQQLLWIIDMVEGCLDDACRYFVWAKYAQEGTKKRDGMRKTARMVQAALYRRGRREAELITFWLYAPPNVRHRYNPKKISRELQIPMRVVERDVSLAKKALSDLQEKAFDELDLRFWKSGLL